MLNSNAVFNAIINESIPSLLPFFQSSTIKRYILFREKNHQAGAGFWFFSDCKYFARKVLQWVGRSCDLSLKN
ncbi:hypothetical protein HA466_0263370 [Hirschfeldia incana]|nr:hypothetical protein HA466_0263370 [Hirschfeldia incana]